MSFLSQVASGAADTLGKGLVGGALEAGFGALESGINYDIKRKLNKQVFEQNKKLSELAYEQNLDMWNKQNAYNTPTEQVARLRAAGINPAIAFGSGNMTGNAEAAPELAYSEYNPSVPTFSFGSPISAAINATQANLQAKELSSRIFEREARAILAYSQADKTDTETDFLSRTMEDRVLNWSLQNSQLSESINIAKANLANINFDSELKVKTLLYFDQVKELQLESARLENDFKRGEINKIDHIIQNLDASSQNLLQDAIATAKSLGPTIANLNAYTHLMGSKADWTDQDKERIAQEMTAFETKMRKINADIDNIVANTRKTYAEKNYLWHKQQYTDALTNKTNWESNILSRDFKYYCFNKGGILGQMTQAVGGGLLSAFGAY